MEKEIYQILKKHKLPLKKREEVLTDLLLLFNINGQLPIDFVKWYSGMEEGKILKAYERWKRESSNLL
jgi:hypothetical protein